MATWTEWKNVGTNFEELTIATVRGQASIYGGADVAGATRTAQTGIYNVVKSGKATLIFNGYVVSQVGSFNYTGINVYHNGALIASNPKSRITINVKKGDSIYAIGNYRVGDSTTTSHVGAGDVVLSIIEHD